jgi:hypothetical protein
VGTGLLHAIFAISLSCIGIFRARGLNKIVFIVYKIGFLVQVSAVMKPWQLSIAVLCGRVRHVEVLTLRCSGYKVQVVSKAGDVRTLEYASGRALWPGLALLKARLRRCGVQQMLLLQPESHDEIIGRPALLEPDPGLWIKLC